MLNNRSSLLIRGYKLVHFVLAVILFIATWSEYTLQNNIGIASRYNLFIYALYTFIIFFLLRTYNAYMVEYTRIRHIAFAQSLATTMGILGVYILTLIAWNKTFSPRHFILLCFLQAAINVFWSWSAAWLFRKTHKSPKSVIVYRNKADLNRLEGIKELYGKYKVVKYIENPKKIEDVIANVEGIQTIFITGVNATLRNGIVKYCAEKNLQCFFLPHVGDVILMSGEHVQAFSVPLMSITGSNIKLEDAIIKRAFDLIIATVALVILSPIFLITAIAIKANDGGSVFYRQDRLTRGGKIFSIYKFRSMRENAEADGKAVLSTGDADDRVTKVGRIIRATRIDELPQLLNIIKGDMSVVGPRPERPEIAAEYEKELPAFKLRLQTKAGLTGYAQVYGKYNTEPYDKLEMDLLYISKMSILLDFQILFATIPILFKKESTEGVEKVK